ncbi:MAG: ATP-dependent helicase HrpB [Gammaproteobacteria bacterium]|nr:ATP-dependent helicase HrpB [Gammaproteobacteria bacterium]
MSFPIDELLPRLVSTLTTHPGVVVQAPPGAGKTTRVPLALLDASWLGNKKIIMLEPRRIAARAAARFMAHSLSERVGETVGYRVRLDNKIGPRTRIEVVTEGILTRMLQDDPALDAYGVVIFDEFHERNLNSDLGLALCLDAQQGLREDLKIIVMSATLDGAAVSALLDQAPILTSEGRSYPVAIQHQPLKHGFARERRGFLTEVAQQIVQAIKTEQGSVLVFLPGAGEIRQVHTALVDAKLGDDILLAPLFGQLTPAEQDAAIQPAPAGRRKIVLASAIAETSLTIEGIRIVIDSGLMRIPRFDPNTGLTQLVTLPVSQASADQRCGRAGRLQAGVCYRLWSAGTHLLAQTAAEILDADLAPLLLELAQWGVSDVNSLRWIDPPPAPHVAQAKDLLCKLGAIDAEGRITAHGKAMAQWGTHPRLAHMLLRAKTIGAGALACEVAAILGDRDILRGGAARESDLQLRIEALRDKAKGHDIDQGALRQAREAAAQWQRQLQVQPDNAAEDLPLLGVVLAYAYPDRIGRRRENSTRYLLSNGRGAALNEGDPLCTQEFIVAANLDGAREARIYLAAGIHREDILKYHSDILRTHADVQWDERNACVQLRAQQRIGEVAIDETALTDVDAETITCALLQGIRVHGLACLPWRDSARELQARMQFVHEHIDNTWPDVSDDSLLASLEAWLQPYISNMSRLSHLERLDLHGMLLAQLSYEQQRRLEQLVPTHITVPSGSRIRVDYSVFPPVLAVRLQEMFGLADTPRIAEGRIAVLLHLLSPAQRPVQITQDLAGFWQGSYHEVKKDLKGRYPKHHWPDNPLEAQATARAKRKGE